ncbi:T9SS type A sorting domain-containing protein [uncultured Flavobacterium sp.]|uniref:T9SS type A sorting domain-containing protein n=1 Tax=uncultured Flavobacterium sp. TaxID=165435 RepID=UPI0030CA2941|tara:strand:- start:546 stop:1016 length:471 start_codon:yes stop_codon:yes gene_type:complete
MKTLFLLLSTVIYGQDLHHQMISSQGTTKTTSSGLIVKQTVGQQSVAGTSQNGYIVQQGFQQSFWLKHLTDVKNMAITITPYPNPFIDVVNFQFFGVTDAQIMVSIFDIHGRIVFSKTLPVTNNVISISLPNLPQSEFLVHLTGTALNYFTKILKK